MTIEIERKFLVDHPLFMHPEYQKHVLKRVIIEQAYLCTMPVVRVRTVTDDGGELAYITIKGPGLLERAEYEYEIPVKDARAMMSMKTASTAMHVIKKMRRYVKLPGHEHIWTVDEFSGCLSGLWLAEVELSYVHEPVVFPKWLDIEVTSDRRFSNVDLAMQDKVPDV